MWSIIVPWKEKLNVPDLTSRYHPASSLLNVFPTTTPIKRKAWTVHPRLDTTRILTKIVITLLDVRKVIDQMSTRELYGIIPFQVHEHFIQCFVSEWESICLEYFGKVERILKDVVETMCETYFGRFQTSGLLFDIRYAY